MQNNYHIRFFLISSWFLSSACSLLTPDETPVVYKASPPPTTIITPALPKPELIDQCESSCANKKGLKKKLCQKKCLINKNKNDTPPKPATKTPELITPKP